MINIIIVSILFFKTKESKYGCKHITFDSEWACDEL